MFKLLLIALSLINDNPPFVPRWVGPAPVQFCIDGSELEVYRPEILAALWVWQKETSQVVMAETRDCLAPRTIAIRLSQKNTTMQTLGVSMYPAPMYQEPVAGDVYLNREVDWSKNRQLLFALLIHELGHSLGMVHYYCEDCVMFPNIDPTRTTLSSLERRMFRCLYGVECGN